MSESILGVVGIPCRGGQDRHHDGPATHRVPALVFGVWCAHPVDDYGRWRVSHGPTGKALFAPCGDVDWFVAIRIAEEMHRVFVDKVPTREECVRLYDGVIAIADDFIRNATDWLS